MIEQYLLDRVCHGAPYLVFILMKIFPSQCNIILSVLPIFAESSFMSTSRPSMGYCILAGVYVTEHKR